MRYPFAYALALVAGLAYLWIAFTHGPLPKAREMDFAQYYYAVENVTEGRSLYDPIEARGSINWHPPFFHLLVYPLTAFSLETAHTLWFVGSLAVLLGLVWWLQFPLWTVPVLLWSAPVNTLANGQTAVVVAVPLLLAWKRSQGWLFGALLMTATVLKPFLLPLWLLPLKARDWRAFAGGTGAAVGWLALGSLAFGWDEHLNWLAQRGRDFPWADHFLNSSFAALVAHGVHPSTLPVWWIGAVGILSVTAWRIWHGETRGNAGKHGDRTQAWCLLMMAGLLASPLAWIYYWIFLLPAARLWGAPWVTVLAVGALWPTLLSKGAVASVYPAALLIAWVLALRSLPGESSGTAARLLPPVPVRGRSA